MKKIIIVLIAVAMCAAMLIGCGTTPSASTAPASSAAPATSAAPAASAASSASTASSTNEAAAVSDGKPFVLAFTSPALTSPAYSYMLAGLKQVLAEENSNIQLKVNSPSSEADVGAQVTIVENFIQMGVNCIAICAMSNDAIGPAVVEANNAKIPVIAFNTPTPWPSGNAATDVGYDQRKAGEIAAQQIIKILPDGGEIGIVEGLPSDFNTSRIGGAKDVLKDHPNIKVALEQSGDWSKDTAYKVTQNMLTANPDIKLIYAVSDEMALGVKAAVKDSNMKVYVLGLDGTLDAFNSIAAGDLDATVDTHLAQEGKNIAKAAIMLQQGQTLPAKMYADPSVVDSSNAQAVTSDLKTTVDKYLNN